MPHFHHFSICNQNQSVSILVIFRQNTKVIALLFGQKCLIFITFQSAIKINHFNFGHFSTKYQGYSLTFWPKMPHFHHFSICNQNQSIFNFGHFSAKYQGYSLTFWPKMPHFHHFSICNQNQSVSILVIFRQNTKVIALLLAKNASFSSLFNLQSKSINFNFGHFSAKYQGYSLTFWPKMPHFHHFFNLQSKSINFNFGHFSAKYQGYSLTFWPKMPHFHHLSICNQNQSISIVVIFRQNTKVIALLFGQKCLIFITFQSAIKINQFQFWSFFGKIPGYSLTFWPKMPHFHHFSICNQNQSISILVIFRQNTKVIALLFGQKCLIFITFQSAIKINQFQFWSFFGKIPRL